MPPSVWPFVPAASQLPSPLSSALEQSKPRLSQHAAPCGTREGRGGASVGCILSACCSTVEAPRATLTGCALPETNQPPQKSGWFSCSSLAPWGATQGKEEEKMDRGAASRITSTCTKESRSWSHDLPRPPLPTMHLLQLPTFPFLSISCISSVYIILSISCYYSVYSLYLLFYLYCLYLINLLLFLEYSTVNSRDYTILPKNSLVCIKNR